MLHHLHSITNYDYHTIIVHVIIIIILIIIHTLGSTIFIIMGTYISPNEPIGRVQQSQNEQSERDLQEHVVDPLIQREL